MTQVVTYALDDGTRVEMEIDPVPGYQPAGLSDVVGSIASAARPAIAAAQEVLAAARTLAPNEVAVTFGVKVTGTANWIVAKAATEASFEVTLRWSIELEQR